MNILQNQLLKLIKILSVLIAAFLIGVILAFVDAYSAQEKACPSDVPFDQMNIRC